MKSADEWRKDTLNDRDTEEKWSGDGCSCTKNSEKWVGCADTVGCGEGFPHEGLAVACARRFLGRGIPMEELLQEARTALLMAAARFDASRGVRFSTYGVPVALGALRALCRNAAPMHVPRRDMAALTAGSCPVRPGSSGLRSGLPVVIPDERRAAADRMRHMTADPELAALAQEDGFEERVLLRDAVRRLGSPLAQVIGLRYLCGLTQREAGQRLGAEQWQVCRWEKLGLERLREGLGD